MKRILAFVLATLMLSTLLISCAAEKKTLKILDTEYAVEDYAICVSKDNEELLGKIDAALTELKNDGTIKKIVDKYISGVAHDLKFQQNAEGKAELKMGTNAAFPPYEYIENDTIVGIDAEIAAAIADKLDMKLVIEDMDFGAVVTSAQTGKTHFGMAGLTVTEDRKKSVNFTQSYATGVQVVIVTEGSEITTVDDLFVEGKNYKIGVQENTTGDAYATGDIADKGLGTVERYKTGADAVQALLTGKIDCVIIDNEPAKEFVKANNK